jgi:hypothetical protein
MTSTRIPIVGWATAAATALGLAAGCQPSMDDRPPDPLDTVVAWRLDTDGEYRTRLVIGNLDAVGLDGGWHTTKTDTPASDGPWPKPVAWWCVTTPDVTVVEGSGQLLGGFATECHNRPGEMWQEAEIQRTPVWARFSSHISTRRTSGQSQSGEVVYPCGKGDGLYTYRLAVVVHVSGFKLDTNFEYALSNDVLRVDCGKGITPV